MSGKCPGRICEVFYDSSSHLRVVKARTGSFRTSGEGWEEEILVGERGKMEKLRQNVLQVFVGRESRGGTPKCPPRCATEGTPGTGAVSQPCLLCWHCRVINTDQNIGFSKILKIIGFYNVKVTLSLWIIQKWILCNIIPLYV